MSKKKVKATNTPSGATTVQASSKPVNSAIIAPNPMLKLDYYVLAGIALLSLIIYGISMQYGYVLDDLMMIQENKFTNKGFAGILDHFTNESMTGYFGEQKDLLPGNRYRPLSLATFALERGITGGLNPGLSHIINIVLYVMSCFFIFRLLQVLIKDYSATHPNSLLNKAHISMLPIVATLLYVAHPLHVEAVANIKGRDEIMCMLFSVLALSSFYRHAATGITKQLMWGCIYYLLALLSKENAITFIAIIPLTIYVFYGRNYLKSLAPLLLTTVTYLAWRFAVSGVPELGKEANDLLNNPFFGMKTGERPATVMYTLLLYVKLLIFPHPLTHDYYPYAIPKMNFGNWQVWLSIVIYIAMLSYALVKIVKQEIVGYGILFYLITLTIVSNLVINVGTFMNDRFMYMPSLGFCIVLAYGIIWISTKINESQTSKIIIALSAIIILPYTLRSLTRVPDWENTITLNKSTFPTSEGSGRANSFMSTALYQEAKSPDLTTNQRLALLTEARPYAKRALEIIPNYLSGSVMLAGIAGEIFTIDRKVEPLLDDFYQIAISRPDVNKEDSPDGKLSSFLTKYLDYLNSSIVGDERLRSYYVKTITDIAKVKDRNVMLWGQRIGEIALEGFPNDPDIMRAINVLNNKLNGRG